MFASRLDDMFSSPRTAHDKTAIVGLNKNIPSPRPLDIAYHLSNRAALSRTQPDLFASRDPRRTLISSIVQRRFA